ncbi:MAG: DNA-binding protein [Candidatus Thorarchaeota archaeon]|nr:DNA-binding protein [Candidatus Thorarchaeota archaeon]
MVGSISAGLDRVVVARLETGEDILEKIEEVVHEHNIKAGALKLIGAVSHAKFGYFDREKNEYKYFDVGDGDLEVVSSMGNIARHGDEVVIHAHMVAADHKGNCYGGHVAEGCKAGATIEVIIWAFDSELHRSKDEATGLHLLDIL